MTSSFSAEPLGRVLRYWANALGAEGRSPAPDLSLFDSVTTTSALVSPLARGTRVVLLRFEDWGDVATDRASARVAELADALRDAQTRSSARTILCVGPPSSRDSDPERSRALEHDLAAAVDGVPNVQFIRSAEVVASHPEPDYEELPSYTPLFFATLGTVITRAMHRPGATLPAVLERAESRAVLEAIRAQRKKQRDRLLFDVEYVAPRTAIEQTLATIIADLVAVDRLGLHDDYFELGGDSLIAAQVATRIDKEVGVDPGPRALMEAPTVAALAEIVSNLATTARPAARRAVRDGEIPASPQQEALWFLEKLAPGANLISTSATLAGDLDEERFVRALERFAARHGVLRTSLAFEGDRVIQRIHDVADVPVDRIDRRGATATELEAACRQWLPSVDLEKAPLWRAALVRTNEHRWELWFSAHHAIWDASSNGVLWSELGALYRSADLEELPIQYADFTIAYRERIDASASTQLAYWTKQLEGASPVELPSDPSPSPGGWGHRFHVDADTTAGLRELVAHAKATVFHGVLAAYAAFLGRWCRQDDVVIAAFTSGRSLPSTDRLAGCFYNTLPLRIDVDRGASFETLVTRARATALDALANGDVPFARIVEASRVRTRRGRTAPFAEVGLTMLPGGGEAPSLGEDVTVSFPFVSGTSPRSTAADLELYAGEEDGRLRFELVADSAVISRATLERMAKSFAALLTAAVARPHEDLAVLPLTSADDVAQIAEWNATTHALDTSMRVHEVVAAQASKTPDAIALEFEGAQMTYRELDGRANALAAKLVARGAGPGKIVALLMRRSFEMLIGVHAVLAAGAAYAPLDPEHPPQRLAFMLEDLGADLVLVPPDWSGTLPGGVRAICVDALAPFESVERAPRGERDDDAAYVIYTSGSTGRPKGVVNVHRGLRNRILWMQHAYPLGPGDVVLQKTPYTFDVSVWELVWPLMFGATLVIARPEGHKDPSYLAQLVRDRGVTTAHFVPSMLGAFLEDASAAQCRSLRRVICSGEALSPALRDRFQETLPSAELHNLYGPTEASIDVTSWHCRAGEARATTVPIGRPIWNTRMYVVDPSGNMCPVGVFGELCIGGMGLSRGYWKRPDLTAERFVPDPFSAEPGARMYRTGDLGRWLADGTIEYGGRTDHQVKIRGLRIELGEIEAALARVPGVQAASVLVREDTPGDQRLVGYVAPATSKSADLRRELARELPDYMVPAVFVMLGALPLTTSGKTDRKALPAPDLDDAATDYVAPRTPMEDYLATTFAEALGVPRVGVHDDFFALGGHSLLVMRVVAQIRDRFGLDVQVRDFFARPTVEKLAECLASDTSRVSSSRTTPADIELPPIVRSTDPSSAVSSFVQHAIAGWERKRAPSATTILHAAFAVTGVVDVDALKVAIADVLQRQDSLRTQVDVRGSNGLALRIVPANEVDLAMIDARAETDPSAAAARVLGEARAPFALNGEVPARIRVVRVTGDRALVFLVVHPISADPDSLSIFGRELAAGYRRVIAGEEPPLGTGPAVRYSDFARWERDCFAGAGESRVERARQRLAHVRPIDLKTDRPRNGALSAEASETVSKLDASELAALQSMCRAASVTPYMLFLLASATLLRSWTGATLVPIGAPTTTRPRRPELADVIGRCFNIMTTVVDVGGDPTVGEALERVRTAALDALELRDVPAAFALGDESPIDCAMNRVVLNGPNVWPAARPLVDIPGLRITREHFAAQEGARNELTISAYAAGDEMRLSVRAARSLFDEATTARLMAGLRAVLLACDPAARLSALLPRGWM